MSKRDSTPAVATPSATVVIAREGNKAPELLLVKRRTGDVFGDSYAFPGGLIDEDESDAYPYSQGLTTDEANAVLGVEESGLDYYVAAIRELFEETGILLARDAAGNWAGTGPSGTAPDIEDLRKKVDKGILPWSTFLREQKLVLASDALHYFAHWETPLNIPKRWSTRFFMARMPAGQDATHCGGELTDSCWLSAAEALSLGRDGDMKLPFPTIRNLMNLSGFLSLHELFDWAHKQSQHGVQKKRPLEINENGKSKFVVRGDPGYPPDGDGAD
jgi:8-oxo-dGTP pyrophosphatase MutT (NUDIX family)